MAVVDKEARQINLKLVYYGPGLAGRTTSLEYIYNRTRQKGQHNALSLAPQAGRPLSFDFVAFSLAPVDGLTPRFHLYTVPGSLFDDPARRLILEDVDGIVFVADSQRERSDANVESLAELARNRALHGHGLGSVPLAMQYNKRDAPSALPVAELDALLAGVEYPRFESVATTGVGVSETLRAVGRQMVARLRK